MHLFNRSNMTNGLYSDVVTEPLKMRLPDVDLDLIFDRFEMTLKKFVNFIGKEEHCVQMRRSAKVDAARKPVVGATNRRG